MSPYDTSALRELSGFMDANPGSVCPNPPRSIFRQQQPGPTSLAGCIRPSDLTNPADPDQARSSPLMLPLTYSR